MVVLTVFLAVCKVKDDNIVQAMQKALLTSVDAWTEYQAARIKLHVDENALSTLRLLETRRLRRQGARGQAGGGIRGRHQEIPGALARDAGQGRGLEKEYERLNFRDDQFDISDAFVSIAIALAAVAALVEAYWLLMVAWGSGGLGLLFGVAGFAGSTCGRGGWRRCWGREANVIGRRYLWWVGGWSEVEWFCTKPFNL